MDIFELLRRLKKSVQDTKVYYPQLSKSRFRISVPIIVFMSFGLSEQEALINVENSVRPLIFLKLFMAQFSTPGIVPMSNTKETQKPSFANSQSNTILHLERLPPCVPPALEEVDRYKDCQNCLGLSRTAISNQVEASLHRLDTEYIDVL
ncbi:aldo keto reductase [Colletotrichum incanum]|nr:aldo keto reductase [Colletotrichum incanum]